MGIFVAPHHQGCGNLFQRGIAGALADAIDGALDLAHAAFDRCQAVGNRHTEIVMAMRGQRDAGNGGDAAADLAEHLRVIIWALSTQRCRED